MDDRLLMHVLEAHAHLLDDRSCFFLWQFLLLLDLLEAAVGKRFDDEVEILLVMEAAEQGSQVGVVEIGLDLDFPQNVVFYLHLPDSLLGHLLDDADEADALLLSHEDLAECALA